MASTTGVEEPAPAGEQAAQPPPSSPPQPQTKSLTTQKIIRCRRFAAEGNCPLRYKSNTPKEELLVAHVREFEQQFITVYGPRHLFLTPPNEVQVPKFLPSTMRPTHLPYTELYDYKTAALFLSSFLNYEPLKIPDKYPTVIPSPANVLKWQAGDCFDFSIVLCSLLIGVGYDAYCVSGFAPRFITTRNEARSKCPFLEKKARPPPAADDEDPDVKFTIPKKPPLESKHERQQEEKETEEVRQREEQAMRSDSDDDPSSDEDECMNKRIHCWVLLRKGQREVPEDIWIEPTTGRVYDMKSCPYIGIDLLWNHKNLWVNMQQVPAKDVKLELFNSRYFEYVMVEPESLADHHEGEGEGMTEADAAAAAAPGAEAQYVLDMPPSWSERLDISREAYHARCYQGAKTTLYYKCKVEQFAPYDQVDGLVQRVFSYKDVRRQIPVEVKETFKHRRDHLVERTRWPMENKVLERFDPGRDKALKEYRCTESIERTLVWYSSSRSDGLVQTTQRIGEKFMEWFSDRDDRLTYHSVTFDQEATGPARKKVPLSIETAGETPIRKMTQKFRRDPSLPIEQDFAKIVYLFRDNCIRVDFHCEGSKITHRSLTFVKNDNNGMEMQTPLWLDSYPDWVMPSAQQVQQLLVREKNCHTTFKEHLAQEQDELGNRRKEEHSITAWRSIDRKEGEEKVTGHVGSGSQPAREKEIPVLERSVYDLARERANEEGGREGIEEEQEEEAANQVDILAPYLVDFQGKPLDTMQAEFVAKKCKNEFRKRLLDRAQIIQKRLEKEQDELKKKRSQMQRRGDSDNKTEVEFEKFQNQAMFRIQILEQRLARHETQAINKFAELEKILAEDPRLAAMWQKPTQDRR